MGQPPTSRRTIAAWCTYDFANSAFTTLVVTFVYAAFFTKSIAPDEITGTALWSRAVTVSALIVALLSPLLGAIADRGGYRKLFLLVSSAICIGATVALYPVLPGQTTRALFWFVIANVSFEMANVFYNAFLPDVAPAKRIGLVSGVGWAVGYVGGLLAMVIALVGLVQPETPWFGFTKDAFENIRATNLLVALWFAVFAVPIFLFVKEDKSAVRGGPILRSTFRQVADTFREIRRYRQITRFLVARLVYNDGLVTIFSFGGIYAAGTFGFTMEKLILFGILLNVTAAIGAFGLGFLDDILGGRRTILITLVALFFATLAAILAPNEAVLWVAGSLIGIFAGPNQAASRSLMGRFVPPDKETEFFGFFAFSGKATAFLGPLLLGTLTKMFDSQRVGFSIILVFFAVGGLIILGVNEKEGEEVAGRS